ncbi:unnamed protein product [Durusdinium trenchii]|uniref:Cleft lip and palate associated transmembrane protein n=1 Tax=Durusdinium trenchii TaxID=1381693 RepID=A0ABP0MIU0_9DINO
MVASTICYVLLAWMVLSTFMQFYVSFNAPRCPSSARALQTACYRPLFRPSEEVDIHVFLTTEEQLQWWTAEGVRELMEVPLFNMTARYGEVNASTLATVPLSKLPSVRLNQSLLYAHSYLVKSGARLMDEVQKLAATEQPPLRGLISEQALHTTAAMVKLQPQVRRPTRKLLEEVNATEKEVDTEQAEKVTVELPFATRSLEVYPSSALKWATGLFILTSFLEPTLYMAALRHGIACVWASVLKLRMDQAPSKKVTPEMPRFMVFTFCVCSHAQLAPAVSTPHLIPWLSLEVSADSEDYDDAYPPPLLYKEMIFDHGQPFPVREREVRYDARLMQSGEKLYAPPFHIDTWGISSKMWRPLELNESREDPVIHAEVKFVGMIQYSTQRTLMEMMRPYMRMGFTERDLEDIKEFLFRRPLHIMILMQVIGILQTMLWTLAFKNDISFFRGREDYRGLSSRSMGTDAANAMVIFLYLYDFDDISRLILFQLGMTTAFDLWKYARVARLHVRWAFYLPWVKSARVEEASAERRTDEIDARAMFYIKCAIFPICLFFCLHNLTYYHYKSWWSWLISSMADFSYGFGFINMLPQVIINYHLKSVAHMPWRVLIYKFFNTFIDDIFAFFIMSDRMTAKHRYMTLRDDLVFFIFLYQRYMYSVDKSRPDEYGFVHDGGAPLEGATSDGSSLAPAVGEGTAGSIDATRTAPEVGGGTTDARVATLEAEEGTSDEPSLTPAVERGSAGSTDATAAASDVDGAPEEEVPVVEGATSHVPSAAAVAGSVAPEDEVPTVEQDEQGPVDQASPEASLDAK